MEVIITTTPTPFNGDYYVGSEIRYLACLHGIQTIIETGTWAAHSSREFAKMVKRVITIDVTHEHLLAEFGPNAVEDLLKLNVVALLGNSRDIMGKVLRDLPDEQHPVLCYLDAHGVGNPLLEDLASMAADPRCHDRAVVVVHDIQVPGKPWGYNWVDYGRGAEPISYSVVAESLPAIWPRGHCFYYNEEAAGCHRGVLYLHPRLYCSAGGDGCHRRAIPLPPRL